MKRPTPSRASSSPGAPLHAPAEGIAPGPPRGAPDARPPHETTPPPRPADDGLFAGRYRIERRLGQGGMGSVYLATQLVVDRKVAIKVLETGPDDPIMISRFSREARVIARLQHPNVVQLIDFGEDPRGGLFLVMEYIDGEALTDLIEREAPLDPGRVVQIGLQLADALAAAHAIGVIHRDLKPDNIMLLRGGTARRDLVKILDFGIAKVLRSDRGQDTVLTQAGLIVGSLRYISPEQVEASSITPQTDLYSYGAILYELLAGRRVFDYVSPADCAIAHLTEPPAPPARDGVALAGPLVDVVMACLAKAPARRPPSAHAVIELLHAASSQPLVSTDAVVAPGLASARAGPPEPPSAAPRPHATGRLAPEPTITGRATDPDQPTDCDLDIPSRRTRRPAAPDATLRVDGRAPSSLAARGAANHDLMDTTTHASGARLAKRPAGRTAREGHHPGVFALLLLALAAIGALFTAFVIVPATRSGEPPSPPPTIEAVDDGEGSP